MSQIVYKRINNIIKEMYILDANYWPVRYSQLLYFAWQWNQISDKERKRRMEVVKLKITAIELTTEIYLNSYDRVLNKDIKYNFKTAFGEVLREKYDQIIKELDWDEPEACVSEPTINKNEPMDIYSEIFNPTHSPIQIYTLFAASKGSGTTEVAKDLELSKMKVNMEMLKIRKAYVR